MKAKHFILSATLAVFSSVPHLQAAVVIDNLALGTNSSGQTISGPTATGFFLPVPFNDREVAFSFTTSIQDVFLTQLDFAISIGKAILGPIQLTLSTGSTVPGGTNPQVIGSITPPSTSPTSQTLSLIPSGSVLLEANTTYWMHITVPSGGAVYSFQNTNSLVLAPGWSLGNSWSNFPGSSWSELNSGPQARIRMTVEPVPEPSAALLGAFGSLLLLRRRR